MVATKQTNMQIPKQQVEALIEQGQKRGLTGKDVIDALVRKGYEPEGVNVMAIKAKVQPPVQQTIPETSFLGGLKEDLNTRVDRVGEIQNRTDSSGTEKALQTFGQGAGLAANTIEKTAEQIPGVKQVFGAIGAGINWLSQPDNPITRTLYGGLIDSVGNSKWAQETTQLYDTDQNFKDSVDAVANIARLGGDVQMAADAVNLTKNIKNRIADKVNTLKTPPDGGSSTPLLSPEGQALVDKVVPDSATIMNRVARLKPTDATKFEKLTGGKTHGEYLTETGNFKAPDEIIKNESSKFSSTLNAKDAELAKLPGLFKNGALDDALTGLVEKAQSTSSANIKSPYLDQVLSLQNKAKTTGLTNEEINIVKRLYEKNVKLGYNKLLNADKVEQATNIDSALRAFQDETAKQLGFTNIPELNKQIQISKFLIDKLGDQVVGQNGLNGVGLSDWVILAGGDPTAVGAFLTKKFFSSKGIQAKIAEYLNKGKIKGQATPETTITPENINRQINPEGNLALPAPAEGSSKVQVNTPINQPSRKAIEQGTEIVPKTSKPQSQLVPKKEIKTSSKPSTKSAKVNGEELEKDSYVMKVNKKVARGEGKGIGNSTLVNGQYFADTKQFASQFGNVTESIIPKGSKVFNLDAVKSGTGSIPQKIVVDQKALTKYLIDKGFDYTRNTNTRGVEFVKLNKIANELDVLASKSSSLELFKKKVMSNYSKYREEIARLTKDYTPADISRLRDPLDTIWEKANMMTNKLIRKNGRVEFNGRSMSLDQVKGMTDKEIINMFENTPS